MSTAPSDGDRAVTGDHSGAVDPAWLAAIAGWLPARRWYAGKHLSVRSVTADAVVPIVERADLSVSMIVVHVSFASGDDQRYAVPVARVSTRRTAITADDRRTIATLDDDWALVDAMGFSETAAAVVAASFETATYSGPGGRLRGRPRRPRLSADAEHVHPLTVEQSNSSVLVGSALIAKLVRRLEPGPNPDAELPSHLADQRFEHVPGLAASLEIDVPGTSQPADVLIVHDAIANDGDLWSVMLDRLHRELAEGTAFDDRHLALGRLLGRRTAELHIALATPVDRTGGAGGDIDDVTERMRPEPFTLDWQHRLLDHVHGGLRATQAALNTTSTAGGIGDACEQARRSGLLTETPAALLRSFDRLRTDPIDSTRIRVHGDLHLGQILSTGDDVVFIDFEGEPGLPMSARLVKRSPLTDIAGLLRSIDYLGRHAVRLAQMVGVVAPTDHAQIDAARSAWTSRLAGEIVEAYLATIAPAHLVPADRDDAQLLLDLYLLDKGLYEIRYELANRPDWVDGPLAAVTEMIRR